MEYKDNFKIKDLLELILKEKVEVRYLALNAYVNMLTNELDKYHLVYKDDVNITHLKEWYKVYDKTMIDIFYEYIHAYDFNYKKIKWVKDNNEIKLNLIRLPYLNKKKLELYYNANITLDLMAFKTFHEVSSILFKYGKDNNKKIKDSIYSELKIQVEVAKLLKAL